MLSASFPNPIIIFPHPIIIFPHPIIIFPQYFQWRRCLRPPHGLSGRGHSHANNDIQLGGYAKKPTALKAISNVTISPTSMTLDSSLTRKSFPKSLQSWCINGNHRGRSPFTEIDGMILRRISASPQSATDSGNTPSESSNSGFPQHHQEASATTSPSMHRGANQPNLEHPKKYGRIEKARVQDSMPTYDVPHSKKFGDQQKGLNWLSQHGKQRFDEFHRKLLASWGVKPGYESTCVLCPEDWSGLEPTLLLRQFTTQKCPTKGAGRLSYAYSDHSTSYARALVWFASQSWPRSGIELDNFLGFGPFKPKDASHTCHHEYCLVHLVFEAADVNQDRKVCHDLAMFLRREGLPIPKHCDRHDQPCLMQVRSPKDL